MDSTQRQTSNTDTCTYQIDFPTSQDASNSLLDLSAQILAFSNSTSSNYLWHKQSFNLSLTAINYATELSQSQHRWLEGKTDVTDAVDDEWFIVYLLKEISKKWTDAVVGVEDDDGEFLLIEAADVLPNWVTPQNAANRLWIHQGHLHLVPLEHKSDLPFEEKTMNPSFDPDEDGFIDRATAISLVRDPKIDTRASKEVEETVWARIDGYPAKIEEHHHNTLAYLPTDIALALEDSPSLITEAVGAFYERDPNMLKACNAMSRFPPSSPLASSSSEIPSSNDMTDSPSSTLPSTVLVPTRLTRPIYSQLILQKFYAPKPFEKAGWNEGRLGKEDERRRGVGMKIACGFEMLYKQTSPIPRSTSSPLDSFDPTTNAEYQKTLKSLTEKGFFGQEVEGSQGWREKESNARAGWIKAKMNPPTPSFAQRVDEAISRARSTPNPLSSRISNPATLSDSQAFSIESSEDWLNIDEAGLEDILRARTAGDGQNTRFEEEGFSSDDAEDMDEEDDEEGGKKTKEEKEEEKKGRKAARRLEMMAGKVEDFVQGRGTVQGAVFDDERSDDGASVDDDEDDEEDKEGDVEMPTMTTEERASRLEKLVAPLPTEEWGAPSTSPSTAPPPLSSTVLPSSSDRPARPAKFEAEKYDGASSDSDSSDEAMPGEEGLEEVEEGDEEDDEAPAVMNEDEMLDMGEEMDEFLKFATETLGLSEEQYQGILGERKQRGAFVPGPAKEKKTNIVPSTSTAKSASSAAPPSTSAPTPAPSTASTPLQPSRNPNLADFDSLMEQMENELNAKKGSKPARPPKSTSTPRSASASSKRTPKPSKPASSNRVTIETLSDSEGEGDDEDQDVEQMDAELQQMLKDMGGEGDGGTMDYNLVKNFLDSFQSQGGFAGPAGNLSGRLGFNLPRNGSS